MNGTGKSTLSRLLYIFEEYQKNPSDFSIEKYSEIQNAEITYNNDRIDWNNLVKFYQDNKIAVKVFNQDYIRNTIHKNDCDSIIVFGEDNKEIDNTIEELERKKKEVQQNRENKNQELTQHNYQTPKYNYQEKSQIFVNQINDRNLIDNHKFTCKDFENAIENPKTHKVELLSEEERKKNLNILRNEQTQPLNELSFTDDIQEIYTETKKILETTIEIKATNRIIENNNIKNWVRQGFNNFYKENKELSNCPFCDQQISLDIWNELNDIFSESELNLHNDIDKLLQKIEQLVEHLDKIKLENKCLSYPQEEYNIFIVCFNNEINQYRINLNDIIKLLTQKKENLNNPLSINITITELSPNITAYNNIIARHNELVNDLENSKNGSVEKLKLDYIASLLPEYKDYQNNKNQHISKEDILSKNIAEIEQKLINIDEKLKEQKNKQKI